MNYCSLDDAFQTTGDAPSPGCQKDYSTREARKEERRKARRCKGPAMEFLGLGGHNSEEKDPDRQHLHKPPVIPAMNPATGLREHYPVDAPQGSLEPFLPRNDDDPNGDYVRSSLPLNIPGTTESQKPCPGRKKFFGADPDGDNFADYQPDAKSYQLQPNFLKAFEEAGIAKAGTSDSLPNPSVNMFWKPLTPSGAQTSFFEHLPPPGGKYYNPSTTKNKAYSRAGNGVTNDSEYSNDEIMKKLDRLFARLDDMQTSSPEQITSELLMFISSGIFVMFLMDLLLKKGSAMRFLKF
jgi:hypothetical protein